MMFKGIFENFKTMIDACGPQMIEKIDNPTDEMCMYVVQFYIQGGIKNAK